MKEIIKHINGVAGRTVTVTGLAEPAMTRDNVLGILNGTKNEVLYVPMFYGDLQSVTYSNGTLTITLADTVTAIANGDKLFVKLYSDYSDPSQAAEDLAQFFGVDGESRGYSPATAAEIITLNNDLLAAAWPDCPVSGPSYVDDEDTDTRYYADGTSVSPIPSDESSSESTSESSSEESE